MALTSVINPQPLLIENTNLRHNFIDYPDLAFSGTLSV